MSSSRLDRIVVNTRELVKQKIQTHIFTACTPGKFKPLILDHLGTRIISSCFTQSEVIGSNVALIENLYRKREPLALEAIYFMAPNHFSISRLVEDFESHPRRYEAAHIFFTSTCPDDLFSLLQNSSIVRYAKTLKELNIGFVPIESQVFSLEYNQVDDIRWAGSSRNRRKKEQGSFVNAVNRDQKIRLQIEECAEQLATFCATLEEFPSIAYRTLDSDSKNEEFAMVLKKKLEYYEQHEVMQKGRSQLLILDRAFDFKTPVLHDLTLQSMIYDILKVENDSIKLTEKSGRTREFVFDEKFRLWSEFRHQHIAEVNKHMPARIRAFNSENNIMEMASSNVKLDMKVLSEIVKKLPDYQKSKNEYNAIIRLAEDCSDRYFTYVNKMCLVEQDIAMGSDSEGRSITSFEDRLKKFTNIFLDEHITTNDKIRIICLFILSNDGISDDHLESLFKHAQIPEKDQVILDNLRKLFQKKPKYPSKNRIDADTYDTARWTPVVKDMMEDALELKLDSRHFRYLPEDKSSGKVDNKITAAMPKSLRGFGGSNPNLAQTKDLRKPKLIIYIRGGVTYPEMRCAYEISKSYGNGQVFIGSDQILTPEIFLESLRHLA